MNELTVNQAFDKEKIALIKNTVASGATDLELQMFLEFAKKTGLDPITKQIYFIKSSGKVNIMTSIDGLRVVAERSGDYEGQTKPEWCGQDGVWKDVWLAKEPPAAARVGVWKRGFREALYGVAIFSEYDAKNFIWKSKPIVMISKVAEAVALRKAFPNDLGGVYAEDEFEPKPDKKIENIVIPKPIPVQNVNQAIADKQIVEVMQSNYQATQSVNSDFDSFTPPPVDHYNQAETLPADNGGYVCKIGKKHIGKTLSEMGVETVRGFADWIIKGDQEKGIQSQGDWAEFLTQAEIFCKGKI